MAENDAIRKELNELKTDFAKLQGDVGELVQALKDTGVAHARDAKDSVADELRQRRDRIRDRLDDVQDRGRRATHEVENEIAQHPLTSLIAAFGVGFVLAKLMHLGGRS